MRGLIKKGIDSYLDNKSFKSRYPVVIIESDDWGSLRTKDKQSRGRLNNINSKIKNDTYVQLDSIATAEDLKALFDALNSVKDTNGNPAKITANVCTANPDFDAIRASDFNHFYYKPFTKTLNEYSNGEALFGLWQSGIEDGIFVPQLHGREHVHALAWLKELRIGNQDLLKAFEEESWGIRYNTLLEKRRPNLQASLDLYNINGEELYHQNWINEGVEIFKSSFGFQPKSFIPPAFTWYNRTHKHLEVNQIKTIQGVKVQTFPILNRKKNYKKVLRYTGQIDKNSNIIFTTRNAFFEPHSAPHKDWIDICMAGVKKALDLQKPAIIGAHRINFVGRLDIKHRERNIIMLKDILSKIKKHYPNVEFLDSSQLADMLVINAD